jgi:hypothetical protein
MNVIVRTLTHQTSRANPMADLVAFLLARAMRQLVSNARTACNAPGAEKFMV